MTEVLDFSTRQVPESAVPSIRKRVESLNKKAEKYDFPGRLLLEVGEPYTVEKGRSARVCVDVSLAATGPVVMRGGWEFVGMIEHFRLEEQNIIVRAPGSTERVPADYYEVEPKCEHCLTRRFRTTTYVLKNQEAQYLQVGSSCVKDFLGTTHTQMLNWVEYNGGIELDPVLVNTYPMMWQIMPTLAAACASTRQFGWVSRRSESLSTAGRVETWLAGGELEILPEDYDKAKALREWILATTDNSGYFVGLRDACEGEYLSESEVGLVSSVVRVYDKYLEDAEKNEDPSQWLGEQGERKQFLVRVERIVAVENVSDNYFASAYKLILILDDLDGNILKTTVGDSTKTGRALGDSVDKKYAIMATVKDHTEYKGRKQTVLDKVKVLGEL